MKIVIVIVILPSKGLSEVTGMVSDTVLRNTVNDRRIVTPVERTSNKFVTEDQQERCEIKCALNKLKNF